MTKMIAMLILVSVAGAARAGEFEKAASAASLEKVNITQAMEAKVAVPRPEIVPLSAAEVLEMHRAKLMAIPGVTGLKVLGHGGEQAIVVTFSSEKTYKDAVRKKLLPAALYGYPVGHTIESDKIAPLSDMAYEANPFCYILSNDQGRCSATPGCSWTPASDESYCAGRPGMNPTQTQFCYINNNNPAGCNNTPFCRYVRNVMPSSCNSRPPAPQPYYPPQPGPQPQPHNPFCNILSNDQGRCSATPGCFWTPASDESYCAGRPGMNPTQTQFCYINNNNPAKCNNTPFCRYAQNVMPSSCNSR
ncbi:MAG: hypothetical protein M0011_00115 [Elusimicrobia bacterium]|nr:hypothetical protein [Elusimicrobiota bacterium]